MPCLLLSATLCSSDVQCEAHDTSPCNAAHTAQARDGGPGPGLNITTFC